MEIKIEDVLKHSIERIKEQYIKPLVNQKEQDLFDCGTRLGFTMALGVIKNDIISFMGEEYLKEYGLDINCDDFRELIEKKDEKTRKED